MKKNKGFRLDLLENERNLKTKGISITNFVRIIRKYTGNNQVKKIPPINIKNNNRLNINTLNETIIGQTNL